MNIGPRPGRLVFGSTALGLALLFLIAMAGSAQDLEDPAIVLEARIAELRAFGDYALAAEAAAELLALTAADPAMTHFDVEDVERTIAFLQSAAEFPETTRRELTRADSLTLEIERVANEGRFAESAVLAEERLRIQRDILGDSHFEIVFSLDDLATLLQLAGDLAAAEPLFHEALEIRRQLLGDRHPDVGASKNNLAMFYQAAGDLAAAEPLLREAIDILREAYGEDDLGVITLTNNLGMLLYYRGDLDGAEPLYREALAARRASLPADSPDVANSLNNLAVLLYARCDYAQAEPLLREATVIWRTMLGEDHPHIALSLGNLGSLLNAQGEFVKAEALHREALAIYRRTLGNEHPDVARSLNNLAHTLENLDDHGAAEPLFREALEIMVKAYGVEHQETALAANNLAHVLQARGNYEEAEPLYRQAFAVRRRVLGDSHLDVALSLSNLASLLEAKGDAAGAEPLYREALNIRRQHLGDANAAVAHNLSSLGHLLLAQGKLADAEPLLEEAMEAHSAACLLAGEGLKRATVSLRLRPPATALAATRLLSGNEAGAWPVAERSLARALADLLMTAEKRPLEDSEIAREESLKEEMGTLERQLGAYQAAAESDATGETEQLIEETRTALFSAEARWSAFREEIGAKYPVSEGQAYSLERIQASMPATTALIGWLDVETGPGQEDAWVYVVRHEGPVTWARCGPAGDTEGGRTGKKEMRGLRGQLTDPYSSAMGLSRDARTAWTYRVKPVTDALDGVQDLVIIPSGPALGVPMEAMLDDDRRLLAEKYAVSYAPSATIYSWLEEKTSSVAETGSSGGTLLLGDPPYTETHLEAMEAEAAGATGSAPGGATRGAQATTRGTEAVATLERLPGSRSEVAMLSQLASDPVVLLGPQASEQELVRLARAGALSEFGTVHLATHALVDDEQPERSALVLSQVGLPDPLESAIAGTRIYDGLLTAKEIVREWDLNADLVTLSACETGLGRELIGEGYIGFAHAFLQAGARSLLVSLWKVEDEATSLLMRRFYENRAGSYEGEREGLTGEPMTKSAALREAKLWLRGYVDDQGNQPYEHPYYWAAFVLIGEGG
jgi:CHAT domain-containing protein/tetratricopeptide (TPR) repeat protein